MALHRATFEVTCDSNGQGSDDVSLKLPSTLVRHATVEMVTVDISDAVGLAPTITINELIDVTDEDWNDSAETTVLGRQLFYVDLATPAALTQMNTYDGVYEYDPRHPVIGIDGSTPTYDVIVANELIRRKVVRCQVYSAAPSDPVTVDLYYRTSGDYRF